MDELMNRCRYAPISTFGRFSALLYPVVGLATLIAGIYVLCDIIVNYTTFHFLSIMQILMLLCFWGISLFLFLLGVKCYTFENRKYVLNKDGITIRDNKNLFYSWNQVYEVAIVVFAASASLQNYQTVICCFFKPPKQHCLDRILSSYIYGIMNTSNFVIIDYSPSAMDGFTAQYPKTIIDYREKQLRGK